MKIRVCIFACVLITARVFAAEPITDKNWIQHPDIKQIRVLYNDINAAQKSGKFTKHEVACSEYDGNVAFSAEIYMDAHAVVRKYVEDGGTGDSRILTEYYYSEEGIPRFTYRYQGSTYGTDIHQRVYFDPQGKHLYTNVQAKGLDNSDSSIAGTVSDPKAAFEAFCKE